MQEPILLTQAMALSARRYSKDIPLIRARGVSVTARAKFDAGTTDDALAEVYYSPDGSNWDTIPFGTVTLTRSASAEVQASAYIVAPEHGYLKFAIKSQGTTDGITWAKLWYSIDSWPFETGIEKGSILNDQGEEESGTA